MLTLNIALNWAFYEVDYIVVGKPMATTISVIHLYKCIYLLDKLKLISYKSRFEFHFERS